MPIRTLTVGFADLDHFSAFSEANGLPELHAMLQAAFAAAGDEVVSRGGRIVKYLGDSLLFTFEDAAAAAQAARAIAGSFSAEVGDLEVVFRVGVATGEVLVAPLGHPSFQTDDILGETVNRAAKLLRAAGQREDRVALCPETAAASCR